MTGGSTGVTGTGATVATLVGGDVGLHQHLLGEQAVALGALDQIGRLRGVIESERALHEGRAGKCDVLQLVAGSSLTSFFLVNPAPSPYFSGGGSLMAIFLKKALKQPAIPTITITKVL